MIMPATHTGMVVGGPVNGQITAMRGEEFEVKVLQRTLVTYANWRSSADDVEIVTHTYQWDQLKGCWSWKGPRTCTSS